MESKWHIAYTGAKFEKKIFNTLTALNITSFLPLQSVLRKWSDRKKWVQMPLFPNYIFVNITAQEKYDVLNVPGVRWFVTFEGKPAIVQEKTIESIHKILQHTSDITQEDVILKGEKVRVTYGPFSGIEGVVIDKKGSKRLAIQLEGIEKTISIDISSYNIQKVNIQTST